MDLCSIPATKSPFQKKLSEKKLPLKVIVSDLHHVNRESDFATYIN